MGNSLHYQNFDLHLAGAAGAYTATVQESPAGQTPAAPMLCDVEALPALAAAPGNEACVTLGRVLWRCAFGDSAAAGLWRGSLAAPGREGGLRLRLIVEAPELAALPWELLYDETLGRFLALDGRTPVVRFIRLPFAAAAWPQDRPLRLHFTGASPQGLTPLDVAGEWAGIQQALAGPMHGGRLALAAVAANASLSTLLAGLREGVDIWHFAGHGDQGLLFFADRQGRSAAAEAGTVGQLLAGEGVQLAVINACRAGGGGGGAASVAGALVRAEIPAVVAMQGALTDEAAATFAAAFYGAIAAGQPLDRAVTSARKAIYALGGVSGAGWWLPALFMRSPDGVLWQQPGQAEELPKPDERLTVIASGTSSIAQGAGAKAVADESSVRADRARRRYLERLRRQCHALPLGALGGAETDDQDLTLDQVYIDLDTTTRIPDKEDKRKADRRGVPDALRLEEATRPLPAWDAAGQTPRFVLLGDPGAGKSSFVRMVLGRQAAALLGEAADPAPGCAADLIPILLALRDLIPRLECLDPAAMPADRRDEMLAATVRDQVLEDLQRLEAEEFAPALCEALADGRCLLALDGLDEVPQGLRGCVRQTVAAVLARYRPRRVIVTCRVRSYIGEAVLPGFTNHTLAPFDEERVRRFAAGWYTAQKTLGRVDAGKAKERGDDLAHAALTAELRELSANPMMLTAMAIVHQAEHQLPPERVRLYKLLVDVLLRRWQQRKTGEARLAPSDALDRFLKDELRLRAAVERLAYEAHRLGRERDKTADLGRGQALTLLEDPALLGNPGLAGEFLDYVDQRAGLLVGQGGDPAHPTAYAFPHRTIQEYLAGCCLVSQRQAGRTYYEHAAEGDAWSLAALYGAEELHYNCLNTNGMLDLAYRLCPAAGPETTQDGRALLWSGQMAALAGREMLERDATTGGDRSYLARLLPRLVAALAGPLPPVERAAAGDVLGRLGDLRLEVTEVDEMQLCFVPAGPFLMGSDNDKKDPDSEYDSGPQRQLDLPAYFIGRHPVTQAQFTAFVQAGGYGEPAYWREAEAAGVWRKGVVQRQVWSSAEGKWIQEVAAGPFDFGSPYSLPNHPVVGITWYEMLAFTRWLTTRWQGQGFLPRDWRVVLPSEAEWEKAARGGLQLPAQPMLIAARQGLGNGTPEVAWAENPNPRRAYPWIGAFSANLANVDATGIGTTSAVGCFPAGASPYAVQDLVGNVWEWTRSLYGDYPYPAGGKKREKRENLGGSTAVTRVLRGGAFRGRRWLARCACRSWLLPDYWNDYVGFRVVVSPIRL